MTRLELEEFNRLIPVAAGGDRTVLLQLLLETQSELGQYVAAQHGQALKSWSSEDDIIQESFVLAFRDVKTLRTSNRTGFVAWLKTIAKNRIRDAARSQSRAKRGGDRIRVEAAGNQFADRAVDLIAQLADVEGNTPSQFAARNEAVDAMNIALANLPDDQREAVRLHFFERLTLHETAEQMDRTWDSVRGLIQRAKLSLRESMHKSSLWLSRKQ